MSCIERKGSLAVLLVLLCVRQGVAGSQSENPWDRHWVASWAAAQQLAEPRNSLPVEDLSNATLRQVVRLSIGGQELRLHISNRFGMSPLHLLSVHIARPVAGAPDTIDPATDVALKFSGSPDVTVPEGADYVSDPIIFSTKAQSDLAITLHLDNAPAEQTGHPGSRATSYLIHGDLVSAADPPSAKKVEHWYYIAGVDVTASSPQVESVVVLGDSITDGHGATTDGNDRWTDVLATRMQAFPGTRHLAVLNEGIGGNHLLRDGIGPNVLARFDHDVLAQAGARYLIVLEGINDIGNLTRLGDVPPAEHELHNFRMIAAYEQIIARAHAHGIKVIGATILPFVGSAYYHPGPTTEADRQWVNQWIRSSGKFDAVVDLDKVTKDPEHPDRLLPAFDCGDHLHPSPGGYRAMGEAVPLALFDFQAQGADKPRLAITFDDLPAHGPLPPGENRMDVITKIISALKNADLPPIYGFVNGQLLEKDPATADVLKAWRSAGYPLGNHTWSHMNLNQHTLSDFESDVEHGEPVVKKSMGHEDWRWFRYPFLAEGDTPEKQAGIRKFLQQHHYKVAAVTMSFGDYRWNEPYARCKAKGDNEAIASLARSYLNAADDTINYTRSLSASVYGHDIPYVLLMHVGAFDAEMLPDLLRLYQSRGFQFIPLPEAENNEFYPETTDLKLAPSSDSLEGAAAAHHVALPPRATESVDLNAICR